MPAPEEQRARRPAVLRPVLIALGVQLLMTAATTAGKLRAGRDDTDIYHRYAMLILDGQVPYRDFRVEYPPLALPLFLLPALASRDVTGFKVAFGVEMLAFNAATVWLVASWVARTQGPEHVRNRLARYTVLYLLVSRLMVWRYDAAAMCLGFAAATAWSSGRPGRGGLAAALGALMKVYPAVVAVVALPLDVSRPSRGRGLVAFVGVLLLGALAWLAIGGRGGVAGSLRYQLGRGFEFGSLYSGIQMLAARVVGAPIDVVRDRAAWASVTPWSPRLLPLVFPIQFAAILAVVAAFVRRGGADGVRYSGAAILAFIVAGKVFSTQYLIWLLPFIAVLDGPVARRGFWIFLAGCAAAFVAPALPSRFPMTSLVVIGACNLKNAFFLALLGLLTCGRGTAPAGASEAPPARLGARE